jgi:hypothetical protein
LGVVDAMHCNGAQAAQITALKRHEPFLSFFMLDKSSKKISNTEFGLKDGRWSSNELREQVYGIRVLQSDYFNRFDWA